MQTTSGGNRRDLAAAAPTTSSEFHAEMRNETSSARRRKRTGNEGQARHVLSEENYRSTLSTIVERDYFPSLPSLRRDKNVLNARQHGDVSSAVAIRRAARHLAEREAYYSDMDLQADDEARKSTGIRKHPRPLIRESITGFHARATSQDNHEFDVEMRKETEERAAWRDVVYGTKDGDRPSWPALTDGAAGDDANGEGSSGGQEGKRALIAEAETPLGLASDRFDPSPRRVNISKQAKNGVDRNSLFFTPQHRPSAGADNDGNEQGGNDEATSKLLLESGGGAAEETMLMPPPPPVSSRVVSGRERATRDGRAGEGGGGGEALVDRKSALSSSSAESSIATTTATTLVEYAPSEKRIHPPATRFPYQNESRLLAPASSLSSWSRPLAPLGGGVAANFDGGHNGNGAGSETDMSTDIDATPLPLSIERRARLDAKTKEWRTLVDMTPVVLPGGGTSVADSSGGEDAGGASSPITTWGNVASTPLVLGGAEGENGMKGQLAELMGGKDDDSGPAFGLAEDDDRAMAARRAADRLGGRAKLYRAAGSIKPTATADGADSPLLAAAREGRSRKRKRKGRTAPSSSTPLMDRAASLTPAARSLLAKVTAGRIGGGSSSSLFPSASSKVSARSTLRSSYTPTPVRKSKSASSSLRRGSSSGGDDGKGKGVSYGWRDASARAAAVAATPSIAAPSTSSVGSAAFGSARGVGRGSSGAGNITDGLLDLN